MNKQQDIDELEKKLATLEDKIKDIEDRLPAHGVKPPIMNELFELEDERDAVIKQLEALKAAEPDVEAP